MFLAPKVAQGQTHGTGRVDVNTLLSCDNDYHIESLLSGNGISQEAMSLILQVTIVSLIFIDHTRQSCKDDIIARCSRWLPRYARRTDKELVADRRLCCFLKEATNCVEANYNTCSDLRNNYMTHNAISLVVPSHVDCSQFEPVEGPCGLSGGQIAGVAVGALLVVTVLIAALIVVFLRLKRH